MATTLEIKNRIKSIASTAKITKALQMVSASKMLKAQDRAFNTTPYAQGLYEIVNMIGSVQSSRNVYLRKVDKVSKILILIVGPGRGFVGSLVSDLLISLDSYIDNLRLKYQDVEIESISIHKVGLRIANLLNLKNTYHFADYIESPTQTDITSILELVKKGFEKGGYDEVHIAYSHIISTVEQKSIIKRLLPIRFEPKNKKEISDKIIDYIFEPSQEEVLNKLLPEYFEIQVLSAILESIASEHSARMIAMQNATDNANELRNELKLSFNRFRQSKITAEIVDIIGGSAINS